MLVVNMDLENRKLEWHSNLEEYLKSIGEKSYGYCYLHKKAQVMYHRRHGMLELPVIIFTSILGALGVGKDSMFQNEQMASQIIGFATLAVAVISTMSSYFGYAKLSEAHKHASLNYNKIYRLVHIELSLPRNERLNASALLKIAVRDEYENLQKDSPLIPEKIIKNFKVLSKKPWYKDIAKPSEANGLESIEIYQSHQSPPPSPEHEVSVV